jgi:hypothetical protein
MKMNAALRNTLLHAAVEGSCQKSLETLLERGDLDLEVRGSRSFTALDYAVQKDDLTMAFSLLSRGAINNKASIEKGRARDIKEGRFSSRRRLEGPAKGYRRLEKGTSCGPNSTNNLDREANT